MIEKLQKRLTALLTAVSLFLFCGIFALVVSRDIQNAYISDRSLLQNQLTSLVYQVERDDIIYPEGWENSTAPGVEK